MTTQGGTMSKPTSFNDLDVKELRRSAVEDFAVPVEETDNKKAVLAAFVEAGVSWKDYVAQHPEVKPDPAPEPVVHETVTQTVIERDTEPQREGSVITAAAMQAPVEPVVAQPVVAPEGQPWLIKMTRENERFDVRGYSFTKRHPYALVKPEDVPYILEQEDGFRQAYPTELAEFYAK
jgi:hypothetical protein